MRAGSLRVVEPEYDAHTHAKIILPFAVQSSGDVVGLEEANGEARRHVEIHATTEAQGEIRFANEIERVV